MTHRRLADQLEKPEMEWFYSSPLGGLSDNLMTIGKFAGSFITCDGCGATSTLQGSAWHCPDCGQEMGVKFACSNPNRLPRKVAVTGFTQAGVRPHWYYRDENWSTAELSQLLLRLPADLVMPRLLAELGVPVRDAGLDAWLFWGRFAFGGKTVQPDWAVAVPGQVVLFEFKRPANRAKPGPVQTWGEAAFAVHVAGEIGADWRLVVVPGDEAVARRLDPLAMAEAALRSGPKALDKWPEVPAALAQRMKDLSAPELAGHIAVVSWPAVVQAAQRAVQHGAAGHPELSWTRAKVLEGLEQFLAVRRELGLLA